MAANNEFEFLGVNHLALVCKDMAKTVEFYRDILGMPLTKTIDLPGGRGQHFFFDIGNGDRMAFFYYFGLEPFGDQSAPGDSWARLPKGTPEFFKNSRHLAIHVDGEEDLLEYRRRLDASDWSCEMQVMHETIESIYTHDPNGYMIEITRAMRPVTPQEDLDANITIDALVDVVTGPNPSMDALLVR